MKVIKKPDQNKLHDFTHETIQERKLGKLGNHCQFLVQTYSTFENKVSC